MPALHDIASALQVECLDVDGLFRGLGQLIYRKGAEGKSDQFGAIASWYVPSRFVTGSPTVINGSPVESLEDVTDSFAEHLMHDPVARRYVCNFAHRYIRTYVQQKRDLLVAIRYFDRRLPPPYYFLVAPSSSLHEPRVEILSSQFPRLSTELLIVEPTDLELQDEVCPVGAVEQLRRLAIVPV